MRTLARTYELRNERGPNVLVIVSDDGYMVNGHNMGPGLSWYLDLGLFLPGGEYEFSCVIDTCVKGLGQPCHTDAGDCLRLRKWVLQNWTMP